MVDSSSPPQPGRCLGAQRFILRFRPFLPFGTHILPTARTLFRLGRYEGIAATAFHDVQCSGLLKERQLSTQGIGFTPRANRMDGLLPVES
jgi:hypothetical protein